MLLLKNRTLSFLRYRYNSAVTWSSVNMMTILTFNKKWKIHLGLKTLEQTKTSFE